MAVIGLARPRLAGTMGCRPLCSWRYRSRRLQRVAYLLFTLSLTIPLLVADQQVDMPW
jgi:hypothetical protein